MIPAITATMIPMIQPGTLNAVSQAPAMELDCTIEPMKPSASVIATAKKPAKITVIGKGNLTGSAMTTFEIKRKHIGEEDVIVGDIVIAKNTAPTPVLVYNGKKLTTKDYSKPFGNQKYSADGALVIEGRGNFTGQREIPVKVVEKKELGILILVMVYLVVFRLTYSSR